MVIVLHSLIYALFMLLSPVLVIGSWLEQRRQVKRTSRGDERDFQHKLETFGPQRDRPPGAELPGGGGVPRRGRDRPPGHRARSPAVGAPPRPTTTSWR